MSENTVTIVAMHGGCRRSVSVDKVLFALLSATGVDARVQVQAWMSVDACLTARSIREQILSQIVKPQLWAAYAKTSYGSQVDIEDI